MIIKRSSQLRQSITVTHVHDIIRLIQVGISVISKLTIARGRTSSSPIKWTQLLVSTAYKWEFL